MDYYGYGDYDFSGIFGILGGVLIIFFLLGLAFYILQVIALWKVYKKAGKGGWEAIVPFYCNWVLVEIAGLNWWWFLFFFAPTILSFFELEWLGWIAYLFGVFNCYYNIAKKFKKDTGFAICLTLFTPICVPILGFSKNCVFDGSISVSNNGIFNASNAENSNYTYQQNNNNLNNNGQTQQHVHDYSFCGNCGTKLSKDVRFCPNCGKENL